MPKVLVLHLRVRRDDGAVAPTGPRPPAQDHALDDDLDPAPDHDHHDHHFDHAQTGELDASNLKDESCGLNAFNYRFVINFFFKRYRFSSIVSIDRSQGLANFQFLSLRVIELNLRLTNENHLMGSYKINASLESNLDPP